MRRGGQVLGQLAGQGVGGPQPVRVLRARSFVLSQQTFTPPAMPVRPVFLCARSRRRPRRAAVQEPSPIRAASDDRLGAEPETTTGGGVLGQVVDAGVLDGVAVPGGLTAPCHSVRITSTASSSISRRASASGQRWPRMCSFSASPLPTPRSEPPLQHDCGGRRGLGDDRRVDPYGRARDPGCHPQPSGDL